MGEDRGEERGEGGGTAVLLHSSASVLSTAISTHWRLCHPLSQSRSTLKFYAEEQGLYINTIPPSETA